jgi:alpha-L-fucosidase 2
MSGEKGMTKHLHVAARKAALVAVFLSGTVAAAQDQHLPDAELDLELKAPIRTWDEAIPLGNGRMGGLVWGEDATLRLSLDRGDLWDERPAEGMQWELFTYENLIKHVRAGDAAYVDRVFDRAYRDKHPTKIPAGRIELDLGEGAKLASFRLSLSCATGSANLADGRTIRAFFSAVEQVALLHVPGPPPSAARLMPPASLKQLGYPEPTRSEDEWLAWFEQEAADGLRFVVALGRHAADDATLYAVAVTSTADGPDPVALARSRVDQALKAGFAAAHAEHAAWWRAFWGKSAVSVPEPHILRHYYLVRYFYGAASRRGAPPMPLQGVWTADAGHLPPWKGDYHNDLNTQMTYMGYQAAGHFDEGACYLDFLWDRLPRFRRFAREFYGTEGAAAPGVMTLAGEPLAGWVMYSLSPTMSAWSAHLFYLHWRYTMDERFLRDRAYPWCSEVGRCMKALLSPNEDGTLVLPLSSSPEIFNNSQRAWLAPNSNYDLMCLRMLFLSLGEMADALGRAAEADEWKVLSDRLGPYHLREDGTLKLCADEDLPGSHRHLSNLMALHPFNLITADGGGQDRRVIEATLLEWDRFGTQAWTGYSFSWMAALQARAGRAEEAVKYLDIYAKAFILRNGFHVNGDQTRSGFSGFTYRPFTLEGNFLAMNAVHEMLLQSWSPTAGERDTEVIRIFPAVPWRWHDASFDGLRTEGGHTVAARRTNNQTTWFSLTAGRDGVVRVRDNFGKRTASWSRQDVGKAGHDFLVRLRKGETITASFAAPREIPDPPANAAKPVVLPGRWEIRTNDLPVRIGADSAGGSRFAGAIRRASIFHTPLDEDSVAALASARDSLPGGLAGLVISWQADADGMHVAMGDEKLQPEANGEVDRSADGARLGGSAFFEVTGSRDLDLAKGFTLEAWIKPAGGGRILDKCRAGTAAGWTFDLYPPGSLRLITGDPHLVAGDVVPRDEWVHVAAVADGTTGRRALYLNGKRVALQMP